MVVLALWASISKLSAQTADFDANLTVCRTEAQSISNNSTDATSYNWDFCIGDFEVDPELSVETTNSNLIAGYGYKLVEENGSYYGFFINRSFKTFSRIDYGNDPTNTPSSVNVLGEISNLSNAPEGLDIIKSNGSWYGIIGTFTNQNLVRIDFPDGINGDVTFSDFGNFGVTTRKRKLRFFAEDENLILAIADYDNTKLARINFRNSIDNNIEAEHIFLSNKITGLSYITGFDIFKDEAADYIGYAVSVLSDNLVRLNFGNSILNEPTVENTYNLTDLNLPLSLNLIQEGQDLYITTSGDSQELLIYDIGTIDAPSTPTLLSFGISFPNLNTNQIYRHESKTMVLGTYSSQVNHYYFNNDCGASLTYSNETNVNDLSYSSAGEKKVWLEALDDDGNSDSQVQTITVSSFISPTISFTDNANECISQPNVFTPVDEGGLTYSWDYDNDGTEDDNATIGNHTFGSLGEHVVALTVNDGTCSNFVTDTISIFPEPPTPTFFTSGAPYCTGADITFTNLFDESDFNGATLTYEWDYNGEATSTERNGAFNFSTEEAKTVMLTASIPGCSTPSAEPDLDLIAGPAVDFSYVDKCLGDDTQFNNQTTGTNITSQSWDFGDSESSTSSSPTHTYSDTGDYNVTLTVSNAGGCNNTLTQPITIDDKPDANFNMGVGCEGQAVAFEDQSTVDDANIDTYTWDFASLGNSTDQNPSFTFDTQGTYEVTLSVESTFGCVDEITQEVSVQVAPTADFMVDLGCLHASTQFADQSETDASNPIVSWYWDINGDIKPNTQNPTQIFDTPGVYTATLTVTPNNLCVSTISKDFTVYELPVANFTLADNCDNEMTNFTDASSSPTTLVAYDWIFDEQGSASGNTTSHHFDEAGDYAVSLTITDEIGCENTTQQTVTINPSPTSSFVVNREIGPAPLTIDFTNKSAGANTYLWHFNDSDHTTSTAANPEFTYMELGEYDVELLASNDLGCSDTSSLAITVAEPIKDLELVQITKEESETKTTLALTVRNNGNVAIRNFEIRIDLDNNSSVFESYTGTLYKDQTITVPLNFSFSTVNNNIGYTCITLIDLEENYEDIDLVNNEGCIDFDQQVIVENSYPNPVGNGDTHIRLNMILPSKSPVQIFLLDATGAVLYEDIYTNTNAGLNSFFIDINSYRTGIYFIRVVYDQSESTQRFAKI